MEIICNWTFLWPYFDKAWAQIHQLSYLGWNLDETRFGKLLENACVCELVIIFTWECLILTIQGILVEVSESSNSHHSRHQYIYYFRLSHNKYSPSDRRCQLLISMVDVKSLQALKRRTNFIPRLQELSVWYRFDWTQQIDTYNENSKCSMNNIFYNIIWCWRRGKHRVEP